MVHEIKPAALSASRHCIIYIQKNLLQMQPVAIYLEANKALKIHFESKLKIIFYDNSDM